MAVCPCCQTDMREGLSCVEVKTKTGSKPIPYPVDDEMPHCHDCNTPRGGWHHPGCDWERCPDCGGQLISCACGEVE